MTQRELGSRIDVIGGGGSGKTTLARELAKTLGLPHTDLDRGDGDLPAADLAQRPTWVLEGIYLYDIEPVLDRATTIIWLDRPCNLALRRIVRRHIRLSLLRRNPHPGIINMLRFVADQREYYTRRARAPESHTDWGALSRAATERVLTPYVAKLVHLTTPTEVRHLRASVRK